jgi:hypothetical protein
MRRRGAIIGMPPDALARLYGTLLPWSRSLASTGQQLACSYDLTPHKGVFARKGGGMCMQLKAKTSAEIRQLLILESNG